MVSRLFAHSSKAIFRTFRETGGALWLRDGQVFPDYIDCHFNEAWQEKSTDGIAVTDPVALATFSLADVSQIDPVRGSDPDTAFKNEYRDKLTINGRTYAVESCTGDGYGWINVKLIGPLEA